MATNGDQQARNWAMLSHLLALSCWLGIPFGHILGPLLIWLLKKDEFPLVDEQGKESLNFQISITLYFLAILVLTIYFVVTEVISFLFIAVPLVLLLFVTEMVLVIIAAVKASSGEHYRYPFSIKLIG